MEYCDYRRNDMVHKSASQNKIPTELVISIQSPFGSSSQFVLLIVQAMKLIKSRNLADMRSVEASIQELLVAEAVVVLILECAMVSA